MTKKYADWDIGTNIYSAVTAASGKNDDPVYIIGNNDSVSEIIVFVEKDSLEKHMSEENMYDLLYNGISVIQGNVYELAEIPAIDFEKTQKENKNLYITVMDHEDFSEGVIIPLKMEEVVLIDKNCYETLAEIIESIYKIFSCKNDDSSENILKSNIKTYGHLENVFENKNALDTLTEIAFDTEVKSIEQLVLIIGKNLNPRIVLE